MKPKVETKAAVVATLTLVIEFLDEIPNKRELEDLVEAGRAVGAVTTADFAILAPVKTSLI